MIDVNALRALHSVATHGTVSLAAAVLIEQVQQLNRAS